MKKTIWKCSECGSQNVEIKNWINPNTGEIGTNDSLEINDCFCLDCSEHHMLIPETIETEEVVKYYPIGSITKADIENKGFDASSLTDQEMERFAEKLGRSEGLMECYWITVEYLAELFKLPKK
jgi:uncharacterized protein with von Willebrand factor type A (vWA) domain